MNKPMILLSESDTTNWPYPEKPDDEPEVEGLPPMTAEEREEHARQKAHVRERMSPPGELGLPPLLEAKRWKYDIMDGYFTREAATFDHVYVFQLPFREVRAPGSRTIILPDITRERLNRDSPRGILLSAGAEALTILRSNGLDIGHTVTHMRSSPRRITVETILGEHWVMFELNVGDICGSEELAGDLAAGRTRYVLNDQTGKYEVVTLDRRWEAQQPQFMGDA